MCRALLQPVHAGFDDRSRCIEIGLADLEVNDAASLAFQFVGARQRFESGFTMDAVHSLCDARSRLSAHTAAGLN